jgi:hypothetical protein
VDSCFVLNAQRWRKETPSMNDIILHALPWGILGLLCLYAGSTPKPMYRETSVRDILKAQSKRNAEVAK